MQKPTREIDKIDSAIIRSKTQQSLLKAYKSPIITIKTLLPPSMRHTETSKILMNCSLRLVKENLSKLNCEFIKEKVYKVNEEEVLLSTKGLSGLEIKSTLMKIENNHKLGSLFNLDVIDVNGKTIARKEQDLAPRSCIICGKAASSCASHNRHSDKELELAANQLINQFNQL